MAYTSNIPNANDNISTSQGQIKDNFLFLGDTAGNSANGFYKLPNGLIVNWGTETVANNSATAVVFSQAYTSALTVYSIQLTIQKNTNTGLGGSARSAFVQPGSVTNTGFNIQLVSSDATNPVYWFAVGT